MALLIPHYTAASTVHGLGLFTAIPLAAGTPLWRYRPGLDQRRRLADLHPQARLSALHYGYVNPARPSWVVLCGDSARYWNFPPVGVAANCCVSERQVYREALIVAACAIAAGEELLIAPDSDADYCRKMGSLMHTASFDPGITAMTG